MIKRSSHVISAIFLRIRIKVTIRPVLIFLMTLMTLLPLLLLLLLLLLMMMMMMSIMLMSKKANK